MKLQALLDPTESDFETRDVVQSIVFGVGYHQLSGRCKTYKMRPVTKTVPLPFSQSKNRSLRFCVEVAGGAWRLEAE